MIKNTLKFVVRKLGYDIVRYTSKKNSTPDDFENHHNTIIGIVRPYTVTSYERIHALIESVHYILRNNIKGDFIECGVCKGGSMMTIALTLLSMKVKNRDLYLFDTFEGMPPPGERDIDLWGNPAKECSDENGYSKNNSSNETSLVNVKRAMSLTGYPMERIHFVKGLVENTLPEKAPKKIALLRLDTDWYSSTNHEMVHLFPHLSSKGILIVDDYGHFKGAKQAVDEYFQYNKLKPFLHRIDYTGRLIIKD